MTVTANKPSPPEAAIVRREAVIEADVAFVWNALRDFGALATRLARGFVTACELEGRARIVTFANGSVSREELVRWNDTERRLVYAIASERMSWHRAIAEVSPAGEGQTRFVWTTEIAPAALADYIGGQMDAGLAALTATLEADARHAAT